MPETNGDYLSALLDDAHRIALGLSAVTEVAITVVRRPGPGPAHFVTALEAETVAEMRLRLGHARIAGRGSVTVSVAALEVVIRALDRVMVRA